MKKIKLLITLSLTILTLAFGSFSVFAVDVQVGDVVPAGVYVFNEEPSDYPFDDSVSVRINFSCNGISYTSFWLSYGPSYGNLYSITYRPPYDDSTLRQWTHDNGWVDDSYRYIVLDDDCLVSDEYSVYLFSNLTFEKSFDVKVATDIFDLFKQIIDWMVGFFGVFVGLFWTATSGLTVLGVLAVIALGISIFFLIFAVVINFFRFRGR